MKSLKVCATLENLYAVQDFIREELEQADCALGTMMKVEIAVEEIYVNIANYAYNPEIGEAEIQCEVGGNPMQITIQFLDSGVPFDPLAKKDADITLSAEEREIGGVGILMVKKSMDDIKYEYKDGKNILTICKKLA